MSASAGDGAVAVEGREPGAAPSGEGDAKPPGSASPERCTDDGDGCV